MPDWLPHVLVLFLVVLSPALSPFKTGRLKRSIHPMRRIATYVTGIAAMGVFALIAILYSPADWFLSPIPTDHWAYTIFALAFVGIAILKLGKPVFKVLRNPELRSKTNEQFKPLEFMLPQTPAERWVFVAVCLMAGFGEEVVFRGFLIRYFESAPYHLPGLLAALGSTVAFGINHAYQGWKGIISTTIVALVLTYIVIGFGSLIPAMVIHALVDLRVLVFTLPGGHRLLKDEPLEAA